LVGGPPPIQAEWKTNGAAAAGGGRNYKNPPRNRRRGPSPPAAADERPEPDGESGSERARARADSLAAAESNSPREHTVAAAPFPSSVRRTPQNSSAPRRAIAYGVQRVRAFLRRRGVCPCVVCASARGRVSAYTPHFRVTKL